jgi:hypothetical protein
MTSTPTARSDAGMGKDTSEAAASIVAPPRQRDMRTEAIGVIDELTRDWRRMSQMPGGQSQALGARAKVLGAAALAHRLDFITADEMLAIIERITPPDAVEVMRLARDDPNAPQLWP